jgi:potassium/chloride transporter 4/5/6
VFLQEDFDHRPRIATILNSLSDYSNTIPAPTDPDAKPSTAASGKPGSARMGTLIGVFLPCIQNIFGVILFIRLTWVVGTAGAIQGFLIVLCCCCVVSPPVFFHAAEAQLKMSYQNEYRRLCLARIWS